MDVYTPSSSAFQERERERDTPSVPVPVKVNVWESFQLVVRSRKEGQRRPTNDDR